MDIAVVPEEAIENVNPLSHWLIGIRMYTIDFAVVSVFSYMY